MDANELLTAIELNGCTIHHPPIPPIDALPNFTKAESEDGKGPMIFMKSEMPKGTRERGSQTLSTVN